MSFFDKEARVSAFRRAKIFFHRESRILPHINFDAKFVWEYTQRMSMAIFKKLYKNLNPKQREAVDIIQGSVMVIAGPGTGKTSILTLRIANILRKTDTPPDSILALTFTEAGVKAMRQKLLHIIGPRAYEVRMHTFHSFANDLIKRYPEEFERIIGSEHMEDLEQIKIVEELIGRARFAKLRPKNSPTYYVLPVIDAIKNLKREDVSPKLFSKLLSGAPGAKSDKMERSKELVQLYRAYETELVRRRLYDFEDMIIEAVRALTRSREFKLELQEEHQYILADEHQDANRSQNRLLELLCDYDEQPNLFIVGDEKQAIFRFQGASLENFLYFKKKFPKARIIVLTDNYRSQPLLLSAAHSLIAKSVTPGERFRKKLVARAKHPPLKIRVVEVENERNELSWISCAVKQKIKKGAEMKEIAVLARDNKDAEKIEYALRGANIAVARRGDTNVLESVRIDALRKLFVAVLNPAVSECVALVLLFDFLELPELAVIDAIRARDKDVLIRRIGNCGKELAEFQRKLFAWQKIAHNEPLVASIEKIARESGFIGNALTRDDAPAALEHYAAFLEGAKRLAERDKRAKLADFLARLERAEAHGVGVVSSAEPSHGVRVMTAHKAKGQEFDFVFIAFAQDGKWGGRRSRSLFELPIYLNADVKEGTDDERRLFYVAITRARREVSVCWHAKGEDGRDILPSRFIFEMEKSVLSPITIQNSGLVSERASLRQKHHPPFFRDKKYLNSLFLEQGFAVTHLNNFLECPLKYFFLNLVRLPRAQTGPELYGQAVHIALAAHFNAYRRDADKPLSETLRIFDGALRRTHLSGQDFKVYLADGKKEIRGYLLSREFPRACWNEYRVAGILLPVGVNLLELTGNLDKVELGSAGGVSVVDYKTGRPKTRNELLGKTKGSDGNYYRQLVFYKLLLDGSKKKEWKMKTGAVDFIKPAADGRYRREVFEISDNETGELKKQITEVAARILDLSFFSDGCGKKECEWCRLCSVLR